MDPKNQFFVKPSHGEISQKPFRVSQFKSYKVGFQIGIVKVASYKADAIRQFQYGCISVKILKLAHLNLFLILNYQVDREERALFSAL